MSTIAGDAVSNLAGACVCDGSIVSACAAGCAGDGAGGDGF